MNVRIGDIVKVSGVRDTKTLRVIEDFEYYGYGKKKGEVSHIVAKVARWDPRMRCVVLQPELTVNGIDKVRKKLVVRDMQFAWENL